MPVGTPRSIAATRVLAIAQRLVITEGTTQNYLSHMLDKTGCHFADTSRGVGSRQAWLTECRGVAARRRQFTVPAGQPDGASTGWQS